MPFVDFQTVPLKVCIPLASPEDAQPKALSGATLLPCFLPQQSVLPPEFAHNLLKVVTGLYLMFVSEAVSMT